MGNLVTLQYPRGPDSSMVEHLVQFQKGLGSSPGLVTFHAAICKTQRLWCTGNEPRALDNVGTRFSCLSRLRHCC